MAQLADTLDVSKATCQRDLDLLAELFIVRTAKDPHHRQRSCYRMVGTFKPNLTFEPLLKRRRVKPGKVAARKRRSV